MASEKFDELLRTLHQRTYQGRAKWSPGSRDDTFIWSGTAGSLSIASRDNDGMQPWVVRLFDEEGRTIEESTYRIDEWGNASPNLDVVSALYTVARESALDIDKTINGLLNDLNDDGF